MTIAYGFSPISFDTVAGFVTPQNMGSVRYPSAVRCLLACGVIGPPLFIIGFLIQGATRAGYNPLRVPVSSLSLGDHGWIQATNFIVTGFLLLAFAIGLRLALQPSKGPFGGPFLIGLSAIGLIGAGLFPADPLNGYPPGTPLVPAVRTTHGILHDLFGVPVFFGLPIACFVFARRFARWGKRGWSAYSVLSGAGMLVSIVFASMGFRQIPGFVGIAGLLQRLTIGIGWTWLTLLAVHAPRFP